MEKKNVHIIGGGTTAHIRSHLALSAPAYGATARKLDELCKSYSDKYNVHLHLTKMADAGKGNLETNEDVKTLVTELISQERTKIIFFNPALADYTGSVLVNGAPTASGKYETRLQSRANLHPVIALSPASKIIGDMRKERKDVYVVGFKTTAGASEDEQYVAGLHLLKGVSANLILANDVVTRKNIIITPEEARYHVTTDREEALRNLVDMAYLRSDLTFTRAKVEEGNPVNWQSDIISPTLREVVDYCIAKGAYKPFRGATAGHFAMKVSDNTFLTSIRKSNFNNIDKVGLVQVESAGSDNVIAYGAKPSVGGQSQRIVFSNYPEYDSIVHFHCPPKNGIDIPTTSQRAFECGSHECGRNTSNGLVKFGNLSAVYLENHGPNIVFNKNINPQEVIHFIDKHFDLSSKTGGEVSLPYTM